MKRVDYFKITFIAFIISVLVNENISNAIPAFARKYQISCQVCHSPAFPQLKSFGEEFANNGFRLTDYESPRYFIPTGDDRLSLFREFPVAIRLDGFATYNFNDEAKFDFGSPFVLKILSGGEISEKLSYYFYFLFNERGEVAGVEDAFVIYKDLFKSGIDVSLGQFQASDPLFKGELRYTLEEYKVYDASPGNSSVSLKYDRGMILQKDLPTGTTLIVEILNGCGIGEASPGFLFDKDKYKNFMLRISQAVGKNVSLGLFGYTGKELLADNTGLFTSKMNMFGPDLRINLDDKLMINMQYLTRVDSKVYIESDESIEDDVNTMGGFAEVIYAPKGDMSKWYFTGLFNWVDSDYDEIDYTAATIHAGYLLRRNFRLVSEYTHQFSGSAYGRVNVGIVTAF